MVFGIVRIVYYFIGTSLRGGGGVLDFYVWLKSIWNGFGQFGFTRGLLDGPCENVANYELETL